MADLNLIYHFQSSQNQEGEFLPARYKVLHFFNEQGFLQESMLRELAKSIPEANYTNLTFLNLDDLKAFALRVSQELGVSEAKLISVQDYNIGLDGAKDLESYKGIFSKLGDIVVNEAAAKKKGLFGKLFS